MSLTRRHFTATASLLALTLVAGCGAPTKSTPAPASSGDLPLKPASAVTLNILDVAGNLQLTQAMIDEFVAKHTPDIISKVTYSKATAPELAGKVKAQQNAGPVDIDLVLTGVDGLAAGIDQACGRRCCPTYDEPPVAAWRTTCPAPRRCRSWPATSG